MKNYITIHEELLQGSDEWLEARRGKLTASEMKHLITPTLKIANNDTVRGHVYEIAAQRISGMVEPSYINDDMLRGQQDEIDARELYRDKIAPVTEAGLISNNRWGFVIAYSPDGLVDKDGLIECKSRMQKHQIKTISEHVVEGHGMTIPKEYVMQCQTALLVTERKWLDFISYCAGLPMVIIRVYPDEEIQQAIVEAATEFESQVARVVRNFQQGGPTAARMINTPPRDPSDGEMVL